jgi:hypothetical protein
VGEVSRPSLTHGRATVGPLRPSWLISYRFSCRRASMPSVPWRGRPLQRWCRCAAPLRFHCASFARICDFGALAGPTTPITVPARSAVTSVQFGGRPQRSNSFDVGRFGLRCSAPTTAITVPVRSAVTQGDKIKHLHAPRLFAGQSCCRTISLDLWTRFRSSGHGTLIPAHQPLSNETKPARR